MPNARNVTALRIAWVLLAASSLALPFFATRSSASLEGDPVILEGEVAGWLWLVFGALDILSGKVAWLAHPTGLAAMGLELVGRRKAALVSALASLALAATAFTYVGETWKLGPGGAAEEIVGLGAGYVSWILALTAPAVLGLAPRRQG